MISNNTPTVYTAAASSSVSLSIVVILEWLLSYAHVTIPPDVEAALGFLIGNGVHWFLTKGKPVKTIPIVTPITEPTPAVPA
jgi:peptidoglycan biosynthesis protein MviN/MurJ (putative lipid II flippase)